MAIFCVVFLFLWISTTALKWQLNKVKFTIKESDIPIDSSPNSPKCNAASRSEQVTSLLRYKTSHSTVSISIAVSRHSGKCRKTVTEEVVDEAA